MRTNDFLANMAKAVFAFAAVLMMSMAFTACSSNEDDGTGTGNSSSGGGGGGAEIPAQTIIIDGEKKTVASAKLKIVGSNDYDLKLYLSDNPQDFLHIIGNTARYNGKTIDMTKKEEDKDGFEWGVGWQDKKTYKFISHSVDASRLCKTGTMKITVDLNTGQYDLTIDNGKVADAFTKDSEHTFAVKWKGKATVEKNNGGSAEIPAQTIMIDGVKKTVASAKLEDKGSNDYRLTLYLSEDPQDYLIIDGNTLRYNGKTIDMTKKEEDKDGFEWGVKWVDKGTYKVSAFGVDASRLCKTGTMKITVDLNTGQYDLTIDNGKVADVYKKDSEHTVSAKWKGKATVEKNNGGSVEIPAQTIMIDGEKKTVASAKLEDKGSNNYNLTLYLSDNPQDFLLITGNTTHHNGKTIDMTKAEEKTNAYEWGVAWQDKGAYRFAASGGNASRLFKTGTMKVTVDLKTGNYDLTIDKGKVVDAFKKGSEHTVSAKWKGKATVEKNNGGGVEIPAQTIMLDGEKKTVASAKLEDKGSNNYNLTLCLSEDPQEYLYISGNTARHNGKTIDMTKAEEDKDGFEWNVAWRYDGINMFTAFGGDASRLCKTGTMKVTVDLNTGNYDVTINNGKVADFTNKNREYTFAVKWKGKATVGK